jgi:hypothetical protein
LPGASVSLVLTGDPGGATAPVTTDSAGNYATVTAPSGGYQVTVTLSGFVPETATVTVNQPMTFLSFVLPQEGVLTGHVTGPNGAPLSGTVTLNEFNGVTDPDGLYRIVLDPASYNGTVTSLGFITDNFTVTILDGATATQDFVLVPESGTLTGDVIDPKGNPLVS